MTQDSDNGARSRSAPDRFVPFGLLLESLLCARVACRAATCALCADACPHDAIDLGKGSIEIAADRCTGCGLCTAACPQTAIASEDRIAPSGETASLVCFKDPGGREATTGCVHALGLERLAALYRAGVRELRTACGDCGACVYGGATRLGERVSVLNEVLSSRGLKPMRATAAFGPDAAETPRDPGRRRFLSRFAGRNPEMPGMTGTRELRAVQRSARREGLTPVNAFAVSIDRGRCNGCDACFRVCPEGALTIFKDENVPLSYKAAQASCTGCGLCVDICDQKATTVDRSTARDEWEIPLRTFRCRACGNESHEPSEAGKTSTYCRICSQTNHAKNLFVVLK